MKAEEDDCCSVDCVSDLRSLRHLDQVVALHTSSIVVVAFYSRVSRLRNSTEPTCQCRWPLNFQMMKMVLCCVCSHAERARTCWYTTKPCAKRCASGPVCAPSSSLFFSSCRPLVHGFLVQGKCLACRQICS